MWQPLLHTPAEQTVGSIEGRGRRTSHCADWPHPIQRATRVGGDIRLSPSGPVRLWSRRGGDDRRREARRRIRSARTLVSAPCSHSDGPLFGVRAVRASGGLVNKQRNTRAGCPRHLHPTPDRTRWPASGRMTGRTSALSSRTSLETVQHALLLHQRRCPMSTSGVRWVVSRGRAYAAPSPYAH